MITAWSCDKGGREMKTGTDVLITDHGPTLFYLIVKYLLRMI